MDDKNKIVRKFKTLQELQNYFIDNYPDNHVIDFPIDGRFIVFTVYKSRLNYYNFGSPIANYIYNEKTKILMMLDSN